MDRSSAKAMETDAPEAGPSVLGIAHLRHRVHGALLALPCLVILGVAAWLKPSETGMETHRQLGLPACGFYHATGQPCPTCGMTTAFAHAAHGQLGKSFAVQPAGCVLSILCAMLVLIGLWSLWSGMDGVALVARVLGRKKGWMVLLAVVLLGWGWTAWHHGGH